MRFRVASGAVYASATHIGAPAADMVAGTSCHVAADWARPPPRVTARYRALSPPTKAGSLRPARSRRRARRVETGIPAPALAASAPAVGGGRAHRSADVDARPEPVGLPHLFRLRFWL